MLKSKISFAVFLGKNIYSWALGAVKQISLDDAKIQNLDGKKENFTKIFSHNCGSSEIPRQRYLRGKGDTFDQGPDRWLLWTRRH